MKKTLLIILLALLGMTQAVAQSDDHLPLDREGVKWVNEKVTINNGDTTKYYYTYEFCGIDSLYPNFHQEYFHACYYYEGDHLNLETDSLIAAFIDGRCLRNHALAKNFREGRQMFGYPMAGDGGTRILYWWGDDCVNFYLGCQY